MPENLLDSFEFGDVEEEWEEMPKKNDYTKIQEEDWSNDYKGVKANYNIGIRALEWKGKSCLAALFGFLNSEYFDKFNVKEDFPKTYEMFHTGLLPEVEELKVLDLDCQFETQSRIGHFGRLVKPLYDSKKIFVKKIKIPKPKINYIDGDAVYVMKAMVAGTKLRIDNNISAVVADSGSEVLFIIDSMSSFDELCNDLFSIAYEDYMAKPSKGEVDFNKMFAFQKGINQRYWRVRNNWFIDPLRDKRTHAGWQIDTYKMEHKGGPWLKKEIKDAESRGLDASTVSPYKTVWVPRTKFDLDLVFTLWNSGHITEKGKKVIDKYWVDAMIRMTSNQESDKVEEKYDQFEFTPYRRKAAFEILEGLAPYILGEVEKEDGTLMTDEELWV